MDEECQCIRWDRRHGKKLEQEKCRQRVSEERRERKARKRSSGCREIGEGNVN